MNEALFKILQQAYDANASDVHFKSDEAAWYRVHGILQPMGEQRFSEEELREMLLPLIPTDKVNDLKELKDIDFCWEIPDVARFRINVYNELCGISAIFRLLASEVLDVNKLNLEPGILDLCTRPKGLILVTGPTGSGKSTTLASMLDYINIVRTDHIITIEDPIEFIHTEKNCLINQREVKSHTQSFSRALRAALREDPDVVLVGEMRDLETTMTALEVAETGHLVLATLHTNTASSTVYRIINQFPKKKQDQIRISLASSLIGVISQVLVPKSDHSGRVGVREIMIVNHAISNLIRENKIFQIDSIIQMSRRLGMVKIEDQLLSLLQNQTLDTNTALEYSPDPIQFQKLLQMKQMH